MSDLGLLSYKLTYPLSSEKEKFRAIYKWVCINIDGDYDLTTVHRQRDKKFRDYVIHTLIANHRTLCTGYAWLVRELALRAGLTCEIVNGYGRSARSNIERGIVNHSWNAVLLDRTWYLCDATWSSGTVSTDNIFSRSYSECYFLTDPELFILNHYPVDLKWSLLENIPTLETFLNAPLIYSDAIKYRIKPVEPRTLRVKAPKDQTVSFSFSENGMLYTRTAVFPRKGIYPYHIRINNDRVLSYKVIVK